MRSVRRICNQPACDSVVPRPPGVAPMRATGLPWKTRGISSGGRDIPSLAARFECGDRFRDAFSAFHVAVIERHVVDRQDAELRTVGHDLACGAQQRAVERALPQAARDADDLNHTIHRTSGAWFYLRAPRST